MPLLLPILLVVALALVAVWWARRAPAAAPTPPVPAPPPALPEPVALAGPGDLITLVESARAAQARGDMAQAGRLLGRLFAEAALSDAARVATEHARNWLAAVRPQVPPAVVPPLQRDGEAMIAAIAQGDLKAARAHLARAIALAAPAEDPAGALLLAGLDAASARPPLAAPGAEHLVAAAEALTGPGGAAAAAKALERAETYPALAERARAMREAPPPDGEAEAWFRRATLLDQADRLDDALAAHDRAVALDPRHARAWADRGHVLNRLGRHADAVDSQERALELDPTSAVAWLNKAEQEAMLGRIDPASRSYRRFLEHCPAGAMPELVERANRQLDALARHQEDATWQRLAYEANQLAALGERAAAEAVYRRIVDLEPAVAGVALHNLAVMFEQAGDVPRALAAYGEALAADPTQEPSLEAAGRLLRAERRWPEALAAWRALLAIRPEHPTAREAGADLAWRLGRFDVVEDLLPAEGIAQRGPHARRLRGIARLAHGDAGEALALFESLPEDYFDAWVDRGQALEALGRPEAAVAAYERAHPADGRRAYALARHSAPREQELLAQAVALLAAQERADGLDARTAADLADARARLEPGRLQALDAAEAQRRAALDALR